MNRDSQPSHSYWATCREFARMMGKSQMWVSKSIHSGLLSEAGITVLRTSRSTGGRGRNHWYIYITDNLIR